MCLHIISEIFITLNIAVPCGTVYPGGLLYGTGEQTWESDTQSSVPVRDARRVGGSSDRAHDSTFGLTEVPEVLHQA